MRKRWGGGGLGVDWEVDGEGGFVECDGCDDVWTRERESRCEEWFQVFLLKWK